jgi:GxxExxY protein
MNHPWSLVSQPQTATVDTRKMSHDFLGRGSNHRDTEHTESGRQKKQIPDRLNALCHAAIGAAIEVHRHLGPGFLESVYEQALVIELGLRRIPFERQVPLPVLYKDRVVADQRIDLIVAGELVIELKAAEALPPIHGAQLISYLKAGAFQVGLLINFNVTLLKDGVRRVLWDL